MRSPRPVLSVYSKNISTTTYSTYDIGIYSLFFVPSLYYLSENASQLVPLIDDVSLILLSRELAVHPGQSDKVQPGIYNGLWGTRAWLPIRRAPNVLPVWALRTLR